MNFFKQISELGLSGVNLNIKIDKEGRLTVMLAPQSDLKDDSIKFRKPISLTGTAEEMDAEFFNTITQPMKSEATFHNNIKEYEAQKQEANKKAAELKDKADKEKKEKEKLTSNIVAMEKLINGDSFAEKDIPKAKELIKAVTDLEPNNSKAAACKKKLEAIEGNIGGLFA